MFHPFRLARYWLAAIAFAILPASIGQAEYGPKTTVGTYYQQTSSTLSVDGVAASSCTSATACFVLFQKLPKKKKLIVQNVSCFVAISAGGLRTVMLWGRTGTDFPLKRTMVLPVATVDSGAWLANSPVVHLFKAGERPVIYMTASAVANWTNVHCNVSGELVKG